MFIWFSRSDGFFGDGFFACTNCLRRGAKALSCLLEVALSSSQRIWPITKDSFGGKVLGADPTFPYCSVEGLRALATANSMAQDNKIICTF